MLIRPISEKVNQLVQGQLEEEVERSLRGQFIGIYQVCHRTGMHITPKDVVMHMLHRPEATLNLVASAWSVPWCTFPMYQTFVQQESSVYLVLKMKKEANLPGVV